MIQVSRTSRYFSRRFEEIYELLKPFSYPLIRVSAGAMMIPHGYGKVFGGIDGTAGFFKSVGIEPALYFAWYVGLAEFVGGIFVALGLLTRVFYSVSHNTCCSYILYTSSQRLFMDQRWI